MKNFNSDTAMNDVNTSALSDTERLESSKLNPVLAGSQRDRFELLSAYMDGEVTACERRQVEAWLESDTTAQKLHTRLMSLRHRISSYAVAQPEPATAVDAEQVVSGVFDQLERRPRRWAKWGGMAIAATFIGVISTVMAPEARMPMGEFAEAPSEGLMIALDQPLIDFDSYDSTPPVPPNKLWDINDVR
ncbi:MAG: hypothetical protein KME20_16410 [Kaiparowitsia implicata GSE-PSE-MK54-09C]|jgi:hypothetical protein|nr:hypothetical protein [Kaiparowitsia implicata GSE-PSE-MK54-09C]